MYIIRFNKESLRIIICNLCPSLELTSPIYYGNDVICHVSPSQQTDAGTTIEASFGILSKQRDVKGAVLYKLRRKCTAKTGNRPNSHITSINNTATDIYLLVVWDFKNEWDSFYIFLVESTNDFTWDEAKLWSLCRKYNDQFKNYNYAALTWLMYDGTFVKTRRKVTYGLDYKLDIIISEGIRGYDVLRPIGFDPRRLVPSLPMFIVLTYNARLVIPPSFKLNIHNQCLNVDLVSPTYIIDNGLECHRLPDYKVYAGDTIRSGFIIKSNDVSAGFLIYKIQRKKLHKSTRISEDTPSTTHLLVMWVISGSELRTDILLVEHDERLEWNKDNLRKLCFENSGRFRLFSDFVEETWSLNDNVVLMTRSKIMSESCTLDIIISEAEKDDNTRMLAHINLER
jgi:hypothetical protein